MTICISLFFQGIARTQSPTIKNNAPEFPTFGGIAGVNQAEVQWQGLILENRPSWSASLLCQVSMKIFGIDKVQLSKAAYGLFAVCQEIPGWPQVRINRWSSSAILWTLFKVCCEVNIKNAFSYGFPPVGGLCRGYFSLNLNYLANCDIYRLSM